MPITHEAHPCVAQPLSNTCEHIREMDLPSSWVTWLTAKPCTGEILKRLTSAEALFSTVLTLIASLAIGLSSRQIRHHGYRRAELSVAAFADPLWNQSWGTFISILPFTSPFQEYKERHCKIHHSKQLFRLGDETYDFLFKKTGFHPSISAAEHNRINTTKCEEIFQKIQKTYDFSISQKYQAMFYFAATGKFSARQLAEMFGHSSRNINADFNKNLGVYLKSYFELDDDKRVGITSLRRFLFNRGYLVDINDNDSVNILEQLCTLIFSPTFHCHQFGARLKSSFLSPNPIHNLLTFTFWLSILDLVTINNSWAAFFWVWIVTISILFEISSLLRQCVEHKFGKTPSEMTSAIFCGEEPPVFNATDPTWVKVWGVSRWWLGMFFYHLSVRLFILTGDSPVHDYHHKQPGCDFATNAHLDQQAEVEAEVSCSHSWGLLDAINKTFESFSQKLLEHLSCYQYQFTEKMVTIPSVMEKVIIFPLLEKAMITSSGERSFTIAISSSS